MHPLTEDSGHKSQGELGGEHGEKPGRGVEAGADLVLLQVVVEVSVVVVEEPRELVHLDLQGHRVSAHWLLRVRSDFRHSQDREDFLAPETFYLAQDVLFF